MSPIDSREKGARAEREAAAIIGDLSGFTITRTRTPGQAADVGDLTGLPGCVIEVKDWADNGAAVRAALLQSRAAAERVGPGTLPTSWIRMRGGLWFVALEPAVFLNLHREAFA